MTIKTLGMGAIIKKLDKLYKHKKGSKHFYVVDENPGKTKTKFQLWERKFPHKKDKK
jgi:hypothetical protein